jgi:hypothetical protein
MVHNPAPTTLVAMHVSEFRIFGFSESYFLSFFSFLPIGMSSTLSDIFTV